jgi:hypothetical protein
VNGYLEIVKFLVAQGRIVMTQNSLAIDLETYFTNANKWELYLSKVNCGIILTFWVHPWRKCYRIIHNDDVKYEGFNQSDAISSFFSWSEITEEVAKK